MNQRRISFYGQQENFVYCEDRFSGFIGGIGSGKSYAGAAKAILAADRLGGLGLVVSPTYPMLRDATLRSFQELADSQIADFHKTEMIVSMRNGAEILFRSADKPDRLRGPNISWAWLDEASMCPPGTWEIVIGRLRAQGRAGPAWVTSTPKGRNWLYGIAPQLTIFRAKTQENPYLDSEFVKSLELAYTGSFAAQELGGEFVSWEGLVYDEFQRDTHVKDQPGPWERVVAGVDEGYTNPAVILVIGIDSDGRCHLITEFYKRRVLQGDVVSEALRLRTEHDIKAFYADPSAAGLIAEMKANGLPVQPADNEVMPGVQFIKARLVVQGDGRPRLTISPSCANTISEFESYAWHEKSRKDQPEKINDHAMDALRYVVCSLNRRRHKALIGVI